MRLIIHDKCTKFGDPYLKRSEEILPEAAEGGISNHFSADNFLPEVAVDVISGAALEYVRMDVPVKFDDPMPNRSQDIRAAHFVMDNEQ